MDLFGDCEAIGEIVTVAISKAPGWRAAGFGSVLASEMEELESLSLDCSGDVSGFLASTLLQSEPSTCCGNADIEACR